MMCKMLCKMVGVCKMLCKNVQDGMLPVQDGAMPLRRLTAWVWLLCYGESIGTTGLFPLRWSRAVWGCRSSLLCNMTWELCQYKLYSLWVLRSIFYCHWS